MTIEATDIDVCENSVSCLLCKHSEGLVDGGGDSMPVAIGEASRGGILSYVGASDSTNTSDHSHIQRKVSTN